MLFATLKRHYLLVIFEINTAFLSGYFPKTLMLSNLILVVTPLKKLPNYAIMIWIHSNLHSQLYSRQ